MSIQEMIIELGQNPRLLVAIFAALPPAALVTVFIQGAQPCRESPTRFVYAVLIYLACIPGIFSVALTAYTLFILRGNLLKVDFFVYFLPIISMAITLTIIGRKNSFQDIPGFDRIQGLMLMIGVGFFAAFLVSRTFIIIGFIGRMTSLLAVALVVFLLLKVASRKLFGP